MEMESLEYVEDSCLCTSDTQFSSCKVIILKELLEECRLNIGALKEKYIGICGEQTEVHRLLEEHKERQASLGENNVELKDHLESMKEQVRSSEQDQEVMRQKLEGVTEDLDKMTSANEQLRAHVQSWDEQIDTFKHFHDDMKILLSSGGEMDENQNLVYTNSRIKQLEKDLLIYKDKFSSSEESHRQLLHNFGELKEQYEAVFKRHSIMMKYTMNLVVPCVLLLFTSVLIQFFQWNPMNLVS